jgi:hypothetical protein
MKKAMFLILILCFGEAVAQVGVVDSQVQTQTYVGEEIREIPGRKKQLIGSTYLYDNWTVGNVKLISGGHVQDIPMKYDILHQELVMMRNTTLLSVKLNFVKDFSLLTTDGTYLEFIVTTEWTLDGVPGSGVYQKLSEIGNFGLVKVTRVYFVKANYYVALDAGQKDDKYDKREDLYFINNSTKVLFKVPRSKKKIMQYFNNQEITTFLKSSKLDFKTEVGLVQLIDLANSANLSN